jgi:SAM-dependent methyltransferase
MTEGFPFEAEAVDVIIADLCLHCFDDDEMGDIVAEIGRVLAPGGRLFCRVNSDKDINHGAGQGEEIQRGLFLKDGVKKRFFDEELIRVCFAGMEIGTRTGNGTELSAEAETSASTGTGLEIGEFREYVCTKYPKEKVVWEFECRKVK